MTNDDRGPRTRGEFALSALGIGLGHVMDGFAAWLIYDLIKSGQLDGSMWAWVIAGIVGGSVAARAKGKLSGTTGVVLCGASGYVAAAAGKKALIAALVKKVLLPFVVVFLSACLSSSTPLQPTRQDPAQLVVKTNQLAEDFDSYQQTLLAGCTYAQSLPAFRAPCRDAAPILLPLGRKAVKLAQVAARGAAEGAMGIEAALQAYDQARAVVRVIGNTAEEVQRVARETEELGAPAGRSSGR